jgi:hypothetical protein
MALLATIQLIMPVRNTTEPAMFDDLLRSVDHLVYATPDLNSGIDQIERLTGVRASQGGQHPGRGTRNALLALGPASYLEIVAPDPDQPSPSTPRAFGLDHLNESRLVTWVAKSNDLDNLRASAGRKSVQLGEVTSGSRRRPDGVLLSWRYTNPATVIADGLIPFFIDWGQSPHPSQTAAAGLSLVELRAEHPDAERVQKMLGDLGLDLRVRKGSSPVLIATIQGPRGRVELR